ncbi:bifunctional riboflavin kinase/FAD synthetase [Romeria aff. gracilis LEGE 07310]|uniref:Riboflavin biosynthesis protein n=1 Tax=Vasconcelosia minhoensis LEGE 07310 TaxID=915328 RepID=A0A8J7ASX1_9CYAN|nr:bifunctional riboflavin kinase/FAD synthetase [Romeria gracilis]MBE9080221.1 bifunctional riboflavin kinase/FAD synthetase [Romeria aff. gracilis LEGE 07310]
MWVTSSLETAKVPASVALGNFDGVHLGHQQVIRPILQLPTGQANRVPSLQLSGQVADCLHESAIASGYSHWQGAARPDLPSAIATAPHPTVVTFFPHPREFFSGQIRPLLTPLAEKSLRLAQLGVDQLLLLPFNQALAALSPQDFVEKILIQGLQAQRISVGSDFRFGRGRAGDAEMLSAIAAAYGVAVTVVPLKLETDERISSSRIRQALQAGNLPEANRLLGRTYTLTGRVVQGQQLGRTIGFPTANLKLPADKYLPRSGVYSVWVYGAATGLEPPCAGVMNIGHRPTVAGQHLSVEVHLLDWSADLYGRTLTVSLENFLRPEQKFASVDALKQQIEADCRTAIALLKTPSA